MHGHAARGGWGPTTARAEGGRRWPGEPVSGAAGARGTQSHTLGATHLPPETLLLFNAYLITHPARRSPE